MIKIAITFDYELFLGKNYCSAAEVLFKPTENLLNLLYKYDVHSTFFADTCSVQMHKKYGLDNYVSSFEKQLKIIKSSGHDVQLHIHPSWLKSEYINSEWHFDTESYRIHSLGFDPTKTGNATEIISDGVTYLNALLLDVDASYKCVAYRAGGYSIQPHSDLCKCLRKHEVLIDSSVCCNCYYDSQLNKYDFRKLPDHYNWWLTPDRPFSYEGTLEDGGLFEVPIPGMKNSLINKLQHPTKRSGLPSVPMQGEFVNISSTVNKKHGLLYSLIHYRDPQLVSFDSTIYTDIIKALNKTAASDDNSDVYAAIICHPKLCNKYVLENMEAFIKNIISKPEKCSFVTMMDIYNDISK